MRLQRTHLFFALLILLSSPLFAQQRTVWSSASDIRASLRGSIVGTVTDIDETRSQLTMIADADDEGRTFRVTTDSLVTQYTGFGATATEVMTGSSGFNRIRVGDRLEVRGMGNANTSVAAEEIILVGHTSTSPRPLPTTGRVEGTVRSIAPGENRIVIEGADRLLYTVTGTAATPVRYRGETYRISNIEVGDRVVVDIDTSASNSRNEVRARSIDVIESVPQAGSGGTPADDRTLTMISGRVIRIDTRTQTFRIRTTRGTEYLVDARNAVDVNDRPLRLLQLRVGDNVEISGQFSGEAFRAASVRAAEYRDQSPDGNVYEGDRSGAAGGELVLSVITGTVRGDLRDGNVLSIEDTSTGRTYDIWTADDFIVRSRTGTYITADQLKAGDRVTVKAVLDSDRRYIAQTIRMR